MMALADPAPDHTQWTLPKLLPLPANRPLPGFEHVKRFRHPRQNRPWVKVLPGQYYTSKDDELISTVLGSCVTACVWDPEAGVGGMNHFMIPGADHRQNEDRRGSVDAARFGIFAMELLINSILKHGGERGRLLAKITGGGNVVRGVTSIGDKNIEFARSYLASEHIRVVGEHVGGSSARKVIFHPISGAARVLEIATTTGDNKVAEREQRYAARMAAAIRPGEIELFSED